MTVEPTQTLSSIGATAAWMLGDAEVTPIYLIVTLFCAASGIILCLLFARSRRLREQRSARLAGALGVVSGIGLYLLVVPPSEMDTVTVGFFSVAGLLGYFLIGSYLGLRATADALETLSTRLPRQRSGSRILRPSRAGYQRLLLERERDLQYRPTDPQLRKEVLEILLELRDYPLARYHAYVLVELLPHGPTHSLALYRLCQILVERMNHLEEAQPHLRRIIRVYPRSFFASYARRLVSQYEAYADREL